MRISGDSFEGARKHITIHNKNRKSSTHGTEMISNLTSNTFVPSRRENLIKSCRESSQAAVTEIRLQEYMKSSRERMILAMRPH